MKQRGKARNGHMLQHVAFARISDDDRRRYLKSTGLGPAGPHFSPKRYRAERKAEALGSIRFAQDKVSETERRMKAGDRHASVEVMNAWWDAVKAGVERFLKMGGDARKLDPRARKAIIDGEVG